MEKYTKILRTSDIYSDLTKWFEGHDFPIIDQGFLSDEIMVCFCNNVPAYTINIYHTNSELCWIAFPLSNPFLSKDEKKGGFDFLFEECIKFAKECGYKYIFTTSPVEIVQNKLIEHGFTIGDVNVNHYIKKI